MANLVHGMRKKSLLRLVFLFAVALLAIILIRGFVDRKPDLGTPEGRQAYLRDFGWEIDLDSGSSTPAAAGDQSNRLSAPLAATAQAATF